MVFLSANLLCDVEPGTYPFWVSVSQRIERQLDMIIPEASFSPLCAVFTVISLTLPGPVGGSWHMRDVLLSPE